MPNRFWCQIGVSPFKPMMVRLLSASPAESVRERQPVCYGDRVFRKHDRYRWIADLDLHLSMGCSICCRLFRAHARTRFAGLVLWLPPTWHLNDRSLKQSKIGALPQTPPGAEPLDLDTYSE